MSEPAVQQAPATPATPAAPLPKASDVSFSEYARSRGGIDDRDSAQPASEPSSDAAPTPATGRDDKGRFLPRDAKAAKATKDEPGKAAGVPPSTDAPAASTAPPAPAGDAMALFARARTSGKAEDLNRALEAAGIRPGEFGINSKQWEAHRHEKAKLNRAMAEREAKVSALVGQVQERYAPYVEAEELLERGDVEGWVRKATRGKLGYNDLAKRALQQHRDEPPGVREMREELAALRKRDAEREQAERTARENAAREAEERRAYEHYEGELAQAPDPRIAKLAKKPAFVAEVVRRIGAAWREYGDELNPVEVAVELFNEEFGDILGPATSVASETHAQPSGTASNPASQSGPASPARPGARAPTTLNASSAAEVVAPIPERDSPERDVQLKAKYRALLRHSTLE